MSAASQVTFQRSRGRPGGLAMATNPKDVPRHYYSLEEYFALEQASGAT
jgi:hypothetical protein